MFGKIVAGVAALPTPRALPLRKRPEFEGTSGETDGAEMMTNTGTPRDHLRGESKKIFSATMGTLLSSSPSSVGNLTW